MTIFVTAQEIWALQHFNFKEKQASEKSAGTMCPPCTIRVNPNDRGVDCARTLFKHKIKKICFGFFTVILGDLKGEGTINLPPQATSRSPPLLGLNHYEQFRKSLIHSRW